MAGFKELDKRDILSVRIDPATQAASTLLVRAPSLAETREEIVELLGNDEWCCARSATTPPQQKEESLIEAVQALPSRRAAHHRLRAHAA